MHKTSYDSMKAIVSEYLDVKQKIKILDVGSCDVNGNYKALFSSPCWTYTGIDITTGPNVDVVIKPYQWPLENESYDVVISGQCLEHVEMPWLWIKEVERVCKSKGLVIILVPWSWPVHRNPVDCWRILPDGIVVLLTKCSNFKILSCKITNMDTMAIAVKE